MNVCVTLVIIDYIEVIVGKQFFSMSTELSLVSIELPRNVCRLCTTKTV